MAIEGKRILITGATGQVAGALSRGLAKTNEVIAMARFSRPGSRDALEAAGVRTCVGDFVTGDFGDCPLDVDYLVHAAANTRPKDAEEAMKDNCEGTGLLIERYKHVKAYLHVSATGCYMQHPDPWHVYPETDDITGATKFSPMYGASKIAGEGLVRTLSRLYKLPTTIARLNVAYGGPYDDGGLPGRQLDAVLSGEAIVAPKVQTAVQSPIHEDDLTDHVIPLLEAATVPATIVNWAGDDGVEIETWVRYLGKLVGKEPNIVYDDSTPWISCIPDPTKRQSLGCECKVDWKAGMRRMVAARHPEVKILDVVD